MKKLIIVLTVIALLVSLSAVAYAAGDTQTSQQGQTQEGRPEPGGQPPQMNGQAPDGEPPADLPERPEMNGQAPGKGGPPPMMNGQGQDGEAPADLPERPETDGQAPDMNGRPSLNRQRPAFIDFDAMATEGVISRETLEKIKGYMKENRLADLPEKDGQTPDGEAPADLPERPEMGGQPPEMNGQAPTGEKPDDLPELPEPNGEAPADLPEPPEMNGEAPAKGGLLNDLLEAGIITQAEYDALCEAASISI